MQDLPSTLFNQAWTDRKITKPVIILIGGYAGTGKSTLAARLAGRLAYTQTIPTGIFRSIAQSQTSAPKNPALFLSTYDLHLPYGTETSAVRRAYVQQCAPVIDIVKSVIGFLGIEKQHLIIEGNHVLPWEQYADDNCNIIELYMYVEDEDQHYDMLGGPTHNRTLTATQFETGRTIHDILYSEARKRGKPVFACSEMDKAEAYLEQRLLEIVQNNMESVWENSTVKQPSDALYGASIHS